MSISCLQKPRQENQGQRNLPGTAPANFPTTCSSPTLCAPAAHHGIFLFCSPLHVSCINVSFEPEPFGKRYAAASGFVA